MEKEEDVTVCTYSRRKKERVNVRDRGGRELDR